MLYRNTKTGAIVNVKSIIHGDWEQIKSAPVSVEKEETPKRAPKRGQKMSDFATTQDVIDLWRPLTAEETAKVEKLIPMISNCLRYEAEKVGKDLDAMVADNAYLVDVAKSVTIDVVKRYINDNSIDTVSMSQMSQSAGGYSVSGTYLVPGGGLFIKKTELARLGLKKQRFGVIEYYD